MITSTTELLSDIVEAISQNAGSKLSRTSEASAISQQSRKNFAMRYGCMQSWFLRSSWLEKMKWLTQLLQGLRNICSLSLILNILRVTCSKSTVYAGSQYSTNFVYDKALADHNRGLHKKVLAETQEADIKWFKTLDDSEQILMLIGLIRLGGGSIIHHVYERGAKLYNQRVQECEETGRQSVAQIKPESPARYTSSYNVNIPRKQKTSFVEQIPLLPSRMFSIKPDNENESEKYDPKDPFVIEVEKQRKLWNDTITKYRIQVEGKPSKAAKSPKKERGLKSPKSDKSGKSSKKGKNDKKSSKSAKSSKSDKKGKKGKGDDEMLDQIQLLPIWIVKKIFGYLDAKTLKKIKIVNKYWAYAIADLQKEQKARKNLDKFIKKMEASVVNSQLQLQGKLKQLQEIPEATPKRRLLKLAQRGAALPTLKGKFLQPITGTCLTDQAIERVDPNRYFLPISRIGPFPRSVAQTANLYKVASCMVNELGFTQIHSEEVADETAVRPIYTAQTADTTSHHSGQGTEPTSEEELQSQNL